MKKLLAALLLATLMLFGACGGDEEEPAEAPAAEEPAEEETEEETETGVTAELGGALVAVATGMEVYFTENLEYPTALSELDDTSINKIPQGVTMEMFYSGDGQSYCLEAVDEAGNTANYSSESQEPAEGRCALE